MPKEVRKIVSAIEEMIEGCNQEIDKRPDMSKRSKRELAIERRAYKRVLNYIFREFPGSRKY